jgi:ribosomal protein S18 acetylase RimI-like enzyme
MPALGNMIRWGKECARTGPWPADGSVAFLVPVPDGATASAEFVRRCLGLLAEQGFHSVVTAALSPREQGGFIEAASFAPFWRLDRAGLKDALGATQQRRLRVVLGMRRKVVGYAICGASEGRGFVQRLAVLPEAQGQGIGKRLLLDGLHWLRGLNANHIVVNTQVGNEAALALYRKVGFRDDPAGLSVLSAALSQP